MLTRWAKQPPPAGRKAAHADVPAAIQRHQQPRRKGGAAWRNQKKKKKNQSKGKHDGRPEVYLNKQRQGGSQLQQSTAHLVWSCRALHGSLQEGPSSEGLASNVAGERQPIPTGTRELSRKCLCCVTHNASSPGFWEVRARPEFPELPKIIVQTTPGLGKEGLGYNPALIHPTSGWTEPLHPVKLGRLTCLRTAVLAKLCTEPAVS